MSVRSFRSFAKINLGLEVVGRRPDGYHELKTVFATLSLCDLIDVAPRRRGIVVRSDHPQVPEDESNLAHKAAVLMQGLSGRKSGVEITIHKRIAPGGGLGGGSSNAAAVLRALDAIWGLGRGRAGLLESARSLGADVPFFLFGGVALGTGRGDEIEPLDLRLREQVLLIQGSGGVSTAEVFRQFAKMPRLSKRRSAVDAFVRGAPPLLLRNDLEPAAVAVSPDLSARARVLRRVGGSSGALQVAMSGSGSSFFLLFDDREKERAARATLKALGIKGLSCSFVSRTSYERSFEVTSAETRARLLR